MKNWQIAVIVISILILFCIAYIVISTVTKIKKRRSEARMLVNNFEKSPPATAEGPLGMSGGMRPGKMDNLSQRNLVSGSKNE